MRTKKIISLILSIVMLIGIIPIAIADDSTDGDVQEFNGHYYDMFDIGMSWTDAKAYCEEIGGHLATITSAEEQAHIDQMLSNCNKNAYWLGGSYNDQTRSYCWVTGEEMSYRHWFGRQPDRSYINGYGQEDSIMTYGKPVSNGSVGYWNDIHHSGVYDAAFGLNNFGLICEWDSEGEYENHSSQHYPEGYDFARDRYHFRNFRGSIEKKYYTELFGSILGDILYTDSPNIGKEGHCFGMSISTIATLIDAPNVSNYIAVTGIPYSKLSSVNKGTCNVELGMTAKEYIDFCHLYQRSYEVQKQRHTSSHMGVQNVYNAVARNADSTMTTGIAIDFFGGPGSHTVYACGVDGKDILVDDSNCNEQTRIRINGDEWSYSDGEHDWNSATGCTLSYIDLYIAPYLCIVAGGELNDVILSNWHLLTTGYSEESETSGSFSLWNHELESKLDTGKCLAVLSSNDFNVSEPNNLMDIITSGGDDASKENKIFWLSDGADSISATNKSASPSAIKLASDDLAIVSDIPSDAKTTITVGTTKSISIECKENDPIEIKYVTESVNGDDLVSLTISGVASSETINAESIDNQINVSGLTNGTVSLIKNKDPVSAQDFKKSDAEVVVTYDNTGEGDFLEVSSDSESENVDPTDTIETDTSTDNGCPLCGETHGDSFWQKVIAIVHVILYFLKSLFS